MNKQFRYILMGVIAGAVTGVFGMGGGMVLALSLSKCETDESDSPFSLSVLAMLPICFCLIVSKQLQDSLPWKNAFPYMVGGTIGGFGAAMLSRKIPVRYLHRILGTFILWGGIRFLCS